MVRGQGPGTRGRALRAEQKLRVWTEVGLETLSGGLWSRTTWPRELLNCGQAPKDCVSHKTPQAAFAHMAGLGKVPPSRWGVPWPCKDIGRLSGPVGREKGRAWPCAVRRKTAGMVGAGY